jgi:predicted MFS family arabinose efflux permease
MGRVHPGTISRCIRSSALVMAVAMGSGFAHVGTSTMPFQVGAVMDGTHRSATEAGLFGFFEVAALAAGMILISPWIDRRSPRGIALMGCFLGAVANVALYLGGAYGIQLAFAVLAGLGYGLVFAATIAGAAAVSEPDRIYAVGNGGALLLIVGTMSVMPAAASRFGALGMFISLGALAILCSPFFLGLRAGRGAVGDTSRLAVWSTPGAPGLLFSWAAFSAGTNGVYAFSERICRSLHLPLTWTATILSVGVFLGLIGTGAVALLGRRVHRPAALMIGMCGSALSCLLIGLANSVTLFAAGIFVFWIFTIFLYSYLLGTAAVLDPSGRLGALAGGCERLGFASGVGFAGLIAEHSTYSSIGVAGFGACTLGLTLGFPNLFRGLRRAEVASVPSKDTSVEGSRLGITRLRG